MKTTVQLQENICTAAPDLKEAIAEKIAMLTEDEFKEFILIAEQLLSQEDR